MTRWALILLVALIALQGTPAAAQGLCGDRATMVRQLNEKYSETRRGFGIANSVLIEVWASSETGGFTVLQSYTTGVSCVLAAGRRWQDENWQAAEPQKEL